MVVNKNVIDGRWSDKERNAFKLLQKYTLTSKDFLSFVDEHNALPEKEVLIRLTTAENEIKTYISYFTAYLQNNITTELAPGLLQNIKFAEAELTLKDIARLNSTLEKLKSYLVKVKLLSDYNQFTQSSSADQSLTQPKGGVTLIESVSQEAQIQLEDAVRKTLEAEIKAKEALASAQKATELKELAEERFIDAESKALEAEQQALEAVKERGVIEEKAAKAAAEADQAQKKREEAEAAAQEALARAQEADKQRGESEEKEREAKEKELEAQKKREEAEAEAKEFKKRTEEEQQKKNLLEAERAAEKEAFEKEQYNRLLTQEVQAEQDLARTLIIEDQLNTLKDAYVHNIFSRVKYQWRYQGAEDDWGCDVFVQQDIDGTVQAVNIQNCNLDNSEKARAFKNSIERAVYKASPLPSSPDDAVFDREILFYFGVD